MGLLSMGLLALAFAGWTWLQGDLETYPLYLGLLLVLGAWGLGRPGPAVVLTSETLWARRWAIVPSTLADIEHMDMALPLDYTTDDRVLFGILGGGPSGHNQVEALRITVRRSVRYSSPGAWWQHILNRLERAPPDLPENVLEIVGNLDVPLEAIKHALEERLAHVTPSLHLEPEVKDDPLDEPEDVVVEIRRHQRRQRLAGLGASAAALVAAAVVIGVAEVVEPNVSGEFVAFGIMGVCVVAWASVYRALAPKLS